MSRTCQVWLSELKIGTGAEHASAVTDLSDFLRRTLAKGFGQRLGEGDLDDLTQESLVRILQRLDAFEERSRFTTWAAAIAVNCAYSELRRRRHQHVSLEDAMEQGAASLVQKEVTHREPDREAALLSGIQNDLTARQRDAVLALLGGLPLAEIARRLDTSQGAIYKLLHDARRRLKTYVEAHDSRSLEVSSLKGGTA